MCSSQFFITFCALSEEKGMDINMNEKKINTKNSKGLKSSSLPVKNDVVNNKEEFVIPFEAACSPEFAEGCILREDEEDKEDKEDKEKCYVLKSK